MQESPIPIPWPSRDRYLTPFLPLVYVAWSDGILSETEMGRIRQAIGESEDLPASAARVLESWLRADSPPSPEALARLEASIRRAARRAAPEELRSLVSLGVAIARAEAVDAGGWATAKGLRVLGGVEELLGVLGGEAARDLAPPERPVPPRPDGYGPTAATALQRIMTGDEDERRLRTRVLELLSDPRIRVPDGLPTPTARKRVLAAVRRLAAEGFGKLAFPTEFGGTGDVAGSMILFETLAYGNLSVLIKFGVQFGLFGGSVHQLGTRRHHEMLLERIGSLDLPGSFAMTERDHGSNVRGIETRADYLPDTDEFVIHTPHPGAEKDWIGNALHGRMATVFAQLHVGGEGHGVHAFLVPVRTRLGRPLRGIRIEDCGQKVGLNGVDNGRLSFDRVRIPRRNLLDRFADVTPEGGYRSPIVSPGRRFFTMLGTLVGGRISIAAASVSVAKTGLAVAVPYSARRRQFGPSGEAEVPILDFLAQQRRLLPALATTYGLHFAVRSLITDYASADSRHTPPRVEALAAGLKAYASHHAQETLQNCREALGGQGYLAANRLGVLREDTDIFTTFEGVNVVLLQLVAKSLLSKYRESMGDLRLWSMVRLLAERAGEEVARLDPVRSRRSADEHLRDPEMQREALLFRESRLLHTVARRLKRRIERGMDSFHAMNECQDHLVHLARAHVERSILESFRAGVERCRKNGGGTAARLLGALSDLYALSTIERDRAWYLESGYMEAVQTKAVRDLVNRLCRELRDEAPTLVRAFGIPDTVLAAPAALDGAPG